MNSMHLQDNLSKAPLAGREQAIQQASADLGQRHGAKELDRQHALDQTRTKAAEDAEGPDNRVDDPPDDGRRGQRRRGPATMVTATSNLSSGQALRRCLAKSISWRNQPGSYW